MNANRDKTQEELEKLLDKFSTDSETKKHRQELIYALTTYINKYYVPKGDLEDPSVSTEVGGNQAVDPNLFMEHIFSQTSGGGTSKTCRCGQQFWSADLASQHRQWWLDRQTRLTDLPNSNPETTTKANSDVPKTFTLDEVEKIIGEDEKFDDYNGVAINRDAYEPIIRNKLRAEQREKLKSIRR